MSFSSILSDARNFMRNNFAVIMITVLMLSIITQMITVLFYPDIETICPIKLIMDQIIRQHGELSADLLYQALKALSPQEKQQLVTIAMYYLFKVGLVFFITNLITMSGVVALISTISYQQLSLNSLLKSVVKMAPQIAWLMLLVILGFIAFSLIATILAPLMAPIAMLAIIFYLTAYIIFLAVIIEPTSKSSFIANITITIRFLKRETRLIFPMIAVWFLVIFLLRVLTEMLATDSFIIEAAFNLLKLLFTFLTVCYLYRLYSLSNKVLPYDSRN